jgi:RNA polymerase sigma-70 factor (ECF subfamily)
MERYADGDDSTFAAIYDALAPKLLCFVRRRTGDETLAQDIVQQTFLNVHRARGSFVRGGRVTPWAYSIARRLLIDEYRRRERAEMSAQSLEHSLEPVALGEVSPAENVAARQAVERLEAALATIPASHREVFMLISGDGLSPRDVAELLGTTTTAVKLRLFRARTQLRLALNG